MRGFNIINLTLTSQRTANPQTSLISSFFFFAGSNLAFVYPGYNTRFIYLFQLLQFITEILGHLNPYLNVSLIK